MPRLPQAAFTAQIRDIRPPGFQGGRRATAEDFGGQIGRGLQQVGQTVQQVGAEVQRAKEEQEVRDIQVRAIELDTQFLDDLEEAVRTGADLEQFEAEAADQFDKLLEVPETQPGYDAARMVSERARNRIKQQVGKAHADRVRIRTGTQVDQLVNDLGIRVQRDPDSLENEQENFREFVSTFSELSPEQRAEILQRGEAALAAAAAEAMLDQHPGELLRRLTEGDGLPGLTAGNNAKYVRLARAEVERLERESETLSDLEKITLTKELQARAAEGPIPDEELPEWLERGVSPSAALRAQQRSIEIELGRQEDASDDRLVSNAGGGALSDRRFGEAVDRLAARASEGIEDPNERAAEIFKVQLDLQERNGRVVPGLEKTMNALARSGDFDAFLQGWHMRRVVNDKMPEVGATMLTEDARTRYRLFSMLTDPRGAGLTPEQAFGELSRIQERLPDAEKRLSSQDAREKIMDAVGELADDEPGGEFSRAPILRDMVETRAAAYMAMSPSVTPEAAVDMAVEDVLEETIVMPGGFRVRRKRLPDFYEQAEEYILTTVLPRELEAAGIEAEEEDFLERLSGGLFGGSDIIVLPDRDKRAVVHVNGRIVLTDFDLEAAVAEWRREVHAPAQDERAKEAEEEHRRLQKKRAEELAEPPMEGAEF